MIFFIVRMWVDGFDLCINVYFDLMNILAMAEYS